MKKKIYRSELSTTGNTVMFCFGWTKLTMVFLAFMLISLTGCSDARDLRPNILLILADDLGYSDIGCYGGDIETPNLNALANSGIRFTQFYNTARCCPSRASILTGLHPHQAGLGAMVGINTGKPGYLGEINNECVTLAEVLGASGYETYMTGKWHVTHSLDGSDKHNWPLQRGFNRFYGTIAGAGSFFDPHSLIYDNNLVSVKKTDYYYTDAITDSTIVFLKKHSLRRKTEPFFMYVAYTAPHWPMHAKEKDIQKYHGRFDSGWDRLREEKVKRMIDMELVNPNWNLSGEDPWVPGWEDVKNKEWELKRMEVYAAMVDCMDQGIGRIIEQLEKSGELNNTIILFLSDNGACSESWSMPNPWAARFGPAKTIDGKKVDYANDGSRNPGPADTYQSYGRGWAHYSNTPMKAYKSGTNEGGISTPMIVSWPGHIHDKGGIRRQMAGIIDIMPTLVQVSGATYPSSYKESNILPMEGLSLLNVITDNEHIERDTYFVEHIGRNGIIDSDGMKLVKYGEKPWELYDLKNDRTETNNLAEKIPEKTEQMAEKWEAWAWRAGVFPKPN